MISILKLWYTRVCYCATHAKFKRIFTKLEKQGFDLFMRFANDGAKDEYRAEFKTYQKNLRKVTSLYNKFSGKA